MKIVINTEDNDLFNEFYKIGIKEGYHIINAKSENKLFEIINNDDIDAYILSNDTFYFKKAVDFIKKENPYIPVIGIMPYNVVFPNIYVDLYIDIHKPFNEFVLSTFYNLQTYIKTFETLKKITTKIRKKISFADCVYDPTRRLLYHKNKEVKKLSAKEGGILEILALNYKKIVKKEIILEKVWRKTDYFAGRSMDVYITYLRNTFRNNNINLVIKNISGIGLIME